LRHQQRADDKGPCTIARDGKFLSGVVRNWRPSVDHAVNRVLWSLTRLHRRLAGHSTVTRSVDSIKWTLASHKLPSSSVRRRRFHSSEGSTSQEMYTPRSCGRGDRPSSASSRLTNEPWNSGNLRSPVALLFWRKSVRAVHKDRAVLLLLLLLPLLPLRLRRRVRCDASRPYGDDLAPVQLLWKINNGKSALAARRPTVSWVAIVNPLRTPRCSGE
jgi:hypothetical protein